MTRMDYREMVVRGVSLAPGDSQERWKAVQQLLSEGWELVTVTGVTEQVNCGTQERPLLRPVPGLLYLFRREAEV